MVTPNKPQNRIISFRKELRKFIKESPLTATDSSIADLLKAVDEKALEYLESK